MKAVFFSIAVIVIIALSCKKNDKVPVVQTLAITEITDSSAVSGGRITDDGGNQVTSRGVCWSIEAKPTIKNSKSSNGSGTGVYTSTMSKLMRDTVYHVRAYASSSAGTGYGDEFTFRTLGDLP